MEATRVQLHEDTLKKLQQPLPQKKKTQLIRKLVIDLIETTPDGSTLTLADFCRHTGITRDSNMAGYITRMLKDEIITREPITPGAIRGFVYSVVKHGKVKITRSARVRLAVDEIKQKAMEWSWDNPDDHDSLHAFISHLTTLPDASLAPAKPEMSSRPMSVPHVPTYRR